MALLEAFLEILEGPTIGVISMELVTFLAPVWIAFLVGVVVGWSWRPSWGSFFNYGKFDFSAPSSPSASYSSPIKVLTSTLSFSSCQSQNPSFAPSTLDNGANKEPTPLPPISSVDCSSSQLKKEDSLAVMEDDLEHLFHLVERTDGGPAWKHMMDRSTPNMSYQAWQRDVEDGPPQYCSRTVYEDATPELMRDFFWDDEYRLQWDDMLLHSATVEECPTSGTMVVHWVRKFPFFCSDREYTIGRRIWESEGSYYCVTKGVPCQSVPRRDKPRRVDLYYSSWFIQAAESRKGNGQMTACEVILFHHEDMGIPWEIAKFGIRQGMWGAVKKIERGFRGYQKARASNAQISRSAFMAQINGKVNPDYLKSLGDTDDTSETQIVESPEKPGGVKLPKVIVFGGVIALACSIDRGLLTKAVIFGVARKFANIGRRW